MRHCAADECAIGVAALQDADKPTLRMLVSK